LLPLSNREIKSLLQQYASANFDIDRFSHRLFQTRATRYQFSPIARWISCFLILARRVEIYLITAVTQLAVLFFELGSAFASPTVTVSVKSVFALAVTSTVTAINAPVGFLLVHADKAGMLQDPATLPQEFLGGVIEQEGAPPLKLHDSIAYPELTKVVPAGSLSATLTDSAVLGPALATAM
jgi:hypothetical protein